MNTNKIKYNNTIYLNVSLKLISVMRKNVLFLSIISLLSSTLLLAAGYADTSKGVAGGSVNQAEEQALLTALLQGKPVRELVEKIKVQSRVRRPGFPVNEQSAAFTKKLSQLEGLLVSAASKKQLSAQQFDNMNNSVEQLKASALLLITKSDTMKSRIHEQGGGVDVLSRWQAERERFDRRWGGIAEQLKVGFSLIDLTSKADQKRLYNTRKKLLELFSQTKEQSQNKPPITVLRSNSLPYRRPVMSPRSPQLTPLIIPTYASSQVPADFSDSLDSDAQAPLSQPIIDQASALNNDPVKLFEFVRNEISTEWYAGAMKGAEGALAQKGANSVDQASLLIALYRASAIPAHYVQGVIEFDLETLAVELGVARDAASIARALTAQGVAHKAIVSGGRIASYQFESTWVSAYVPYANYRGSSADKSGSVWLPLMPAVKGYNIAPSSALLTTATPAFDANQFIASYLAEVASETAYDLLRRDLEAQLNQSGSSIEDQLGRREIVPEVLGILPNSVPAKVVAVTAESAHLPGEKIQQVQIKVRAGQDLSSDVVIDYTASLAELASQRLTLSYIPDTVDDHRTINRNGGLDLTPAYLVRLRPQLRLNGRQKAVGQAGMSPGEPHHIEIILTGPWGERRVEQNLLVGSYHALALSAGLAHYSPPEDRDTADTEYNGATLLARAAYEYTARWDADEQELAQLYGLTVAKPIPSLVFASNALRIDRVFGNVHQMHWRGVQLDAALREREVLADSSSHGRDWMSLSALNGSSLEAQIFEDLFVTNAVSADRGLQLAKEQNIEIRTIQNSSDLVNLANIPSEIKTQLENWISQGYEITLPVDTVSRDAWQGYVWRVLDPQTGSAGYFITDNLAGGSTTPDPREWVSELIRDSLRGINSPDANNDPTAVATLLKMPSTDYQEGVVGETMEKALTVRAFDEDGLPVAGAQVTFSAVVGGNFNGSATFTAQTDSLGLATAEYTLDNSTAIQPTYVKRNSSDRYPSQAGLHLVDVRAIGKGGAMVKANAPFNAYAYADKISKFVLHKGSGERRTNPGLLFGTFKFLATDMHGNPVANEDVTVKGLSGISRESCPDAPGTGKVYEPGSCSGTITARNCGKSSLDVTTGSLGIAAASLLAGPAWAADYPFSATAGGISESVDDLKTLNGSALKIENDQALSNYCAAPEAAIRSVTFAPFGVKGQDVAAAAPGAVIDFDFEWNVSYGVAENYVLEPYSSGDGHAWITERDMVWRSTTANGVQAIASGGASASISGTRPYRFTITAPPAPSMANVGISYQSVNGTIPVFIGGDEAEVLMEKLSEHSFPTTHASLFTVWAVEAEATGVESKGQAQIFLESTAEEGVLQSTENAKINFEIKPAAYIANQVIVELYEDGKLMQSLPALGDSGTSAAIIPRGTVFDVEKNYRAVVVVNPSSKFEIRSSKFPVPVFTSVLERVTGSASMSREVDVANQLSCDLGSKIEFSLLQAAKVDLVAYPVNSSGDVSSSGTDLISGESYAAGSHEYALVPFDTPLVPSSYQFVMTAVSEKDGVTEEEKGRIKYTLKTEDRSSLGATIIKGVDLFKGSLSQSATDFSVGGRGPGLSLRRNFHSDGINEIGPLGRGWGHNYASKVTLNNCGVFSVGGVGGGARFNVNDQGDLVPQRGYHSDLIRDAKGNFDFFAKDGTHYHFRKSSMPGKSTWLLSYIQDTNGNTVDLGYDPSVASYIKLDVIKDNAGRSISFTYEKISPIERDSNPDDDWVIKTATLKTGSDVDDLVMTYSYDDNGNLKVATRSGKPARTDRYDYEKTSGLTGEVPFLLKSYTNTLDQPVVYSYEKAELNLSLLAGDRAGQPYTLELPQFQVSEITELERGSTTFGYTGREPGGQPATAVTAGGVTRTYGMNLDGAVTEIDGPEGITTQDWDRAHAVLKSRTEPNNVTHIFEYDEFGNRTRETISGGKLLKRSGNSAQLTVTPAMRSWYYLLLSNPLNTSIKIKTRLREQTDFVGNKVNYSWDSRGNMTGREDQEDNLTQYKYNSYGDMHLMITAKQQSVSYGHDQYGNVGSTAGLGKTTSANWDSRGRRLSFKDGNSNNTQYDYDDLDNLISASYNDGTSMSMLYDALGNKTTETTDIGVKLSYGYDGANRLNSISRTNDAALRSFGYDARDNMLSETDWSGNPTSHGYDNRDCRTSTHLAPAANGLGGNQSAANLQMNCDSVGNIISIRDGNSNSVLHEYDAFNRQVSSQLDDSTMLYSGYDAQGNMLFEIDGKGQATTYTYDKANRRKARTNADLKTYFWEYDGNNNVKREVNERRDERTTGVDEVARITRINDFSGRRQEIHYFPEGQVKRTVDGLGRGDSFTYDQRNRLETSKDGEQNPTSRSYSGGLLRSEDWPNGNVVSYSYDSLGRNTLITDTTGQVSAQVYDKNGNVIEQRDGKNQPTRQDYNTLNQLIRITLPSTEAGPRVLKKGYDAAGNLLFDMDPRNHRVDYSYDQRNRLQESSQSYNGASIRETRSYDRNNNLLTLNDWRNKTSSYGYDALNRRISIKDPLLKTEHFLYDEVGNLIKHTDKRQIDSSHSYDGEGRLKSSHRKGIRMVKNDYDSAGNLVNVLDANNNKTVYLYEDKRNLRTTESRPETALTEYRYDLMGDLERTKDPVGRIVENSYDQRRRLASSSINNGQETTSYGYDLNNNRTSKQRPKSATTWSYSYNPGNQLASVRDPVTNSSRYTYDANGNLKTFTDGEQNITRYDYDSLNRRIKMTYPGGSGSVSYGYDANGNRTSMLDANQNSISSDYDELNRRTSVTYPGEGSFGYAFDANNNLISVSNNGRSANYSYDDFDRRNQEQVTDGDNSYRLVHVYDTNGNRQSLSYTASGNPIRHITYQYDKLNRVTQLGSRSGNIGYSYFRDGRVKKLSYPSGAAANYQWDGAGRVSDISHYVNGTSLAQYAYAYDANGNRITQRESNGGAEEATAYTYDDADRLQSITYPDKTVSYSFDRAWNRVTETTSGSSTGNGTQQYSYNARNQLAQIDTGQFASSINYAYDANGNRIQKRKGPDRQDFTWSSRDQLTSINACTVTEASPNSCSSAATETANYAYDYQGLRIQKTTAGDTTYYVYDDQSALLTRDNSGATQSEYLWGGDRLVGMLDVQQGAQYHHHDALGSVIALSKVGGSLQGRYQYDAWGKARSTVGDSNNRFGFTGHELDKETGLYYAKARYYDTDIGTFLSSDPFEGNSDMPPSLNKYLYAFGNPTYYIDPDGRAACGGLCLFGIGVLATSTYDYFTSGRQERVRQQIQPESFGGELAASSIAFSQSTANTLSLGFFDAGQQGGVGGQIQLARDMVGETDLRAAGREFTSSNGDAVLGALHAIKGTAQLAETAIGAFTGIRARLPKKSQAQQMAESTSGTQPVLTRAGDPPGTMRNSADRLVDEKTKKFVSDPNKTKTPSDGVTADDLRKTKRYKNNRKNVVGEGKTCELCQEKPATQSDHIDPVDRIAKEGNKRRASLEELDEIANSPDNLAGTCGGKGGCNPSKSNLILSEEPGKGKYVAKNPTQRMQDKAKEFKERGL